jgi:hypothetical protein
MEEAPYSRKLGQAAFTGSNQPTKNWLQCANGRMARAESLAGCPPLATQILIWTLVETMGVGSFLASGPMIDSCLGAAE